MCYQCDNDNDDDDDDDDMDEEWVDASWNGEEDAIEIEKKWLERAKALIIEHQVIDPSQAYKVVQILEVEMELKPYDEDVVQTVVVALRETKDEREVMAARLAKAAEDKDPDPDDPEACGHCAHHADKHDYGAGDPLNVPCAKCPDGVCHRQPAEPKIGLEAVKNVVRKGQRKRALLAAVCMIPACGCNGTPHA